MSAVNVARSRSRLALERNERSNRAIRERRNNDRVKESRAKQRERERDAASSSRPIEMTEADPMRRRACVGEALSTVLPEGSVY